MTVEEYLDELTKGIDRMESESFGRGERDVPTAPVVDSEDSGLAWYCDYRWSDTRTDTCPTCGRTRQASFALGNKVLGT